MGNVLQCVTAVDGYAVATSAPNDKQVLSTVMAPIASAVDATVNKAYVVRRLSAAGISGQGVGGDGTDGVNAGCYPCVDPSNNGTNNQAVQYVNAVRRWFHRSASETWQYVPNGGGAPTFLGSGTIDESINKLVPAGAVGQTLIPTVSNSIPLTYSWQFISGGGFPCEGVTSGQSVITSATDALLTFTGKVETAPGAPPGNTGESVSSGSVDSTVEMNIGTFIHDLYTFLKTISFDFTSTMFEIYYCNQVSTVLQLAGPDSHGGYLQTLLGGTGSNIAYDGKCYPIQGFYKSPPAASGTLYTIWANTPITGAFYSSILGQSPILYSNLGYGTVCADRVIIKPLQDDDYIIVEQTYAAVDTTGSNTTTIVLRVQTSGTITAGSTLEIGPTSAIFNLPFSGTYSGVTVGIASILIVALFGTTVEQYMQSLTLAGGGTWTNVILTTAW